MQQRLRGMKRERFSDFTLRNPELMDCFWYYEKQKNWAYTGVRESHFFWAFLVWHEILKRKSSEAD